MPLDGPKGWAALSARGSRSRQEDACMVAPDLGFGAVSDGMGGRANGHLASQGAVAAMYRYAREAAATGAPPDPTVAVRRAVQAVIAVPSRDAKHPLGAGAPGCTATFAWITRPPRWPMNRGAQLTLGHVGDSRAYFWTHDGALRRLTQDHQLPPPDDHVLSNCIGGGFTTSVWSASVTVTEPGVLLLCTDGLTKQVTDDALVRIFGAAAGLDDGVTRAVRAAEAWPESDNVTLVAMRINPAAPFPL